MYLITYISKKYFEDFRVIYIKYTQLYIIPGQIQTKEHYLIDGMKKKTNS